MSTAPVEAAPGSGALRIEVVHCPGPGVADVTALQLPPGSTLADALRASGVAQRHGWAIDAALRAGVWGKAQPLDTPLRDRDRVEVYRPLQVDPKEARRLRYRQHLESVEARRARNPGAPPAGGRGR